MKDLHHFYNNRKNEFTKKCESLKGKINRIAFGRTIVALVFIPVIYFAVSQTIFWYVVVMLILIFLVLVSKHGKLQKQYELHQNLRQLNELELHALDHHYASFNDGSQYANPHHPYSYDLDLFGPGSLFQYLNRCATTIGEEELAKNLNGSENLEERILDRQKAIAELATKVEFRQGFWAQGHTFQDNKKDTKGLFEWLGEQDVVFKNKTFSILLVVFPVISLALLSLTIYNSIYFPLLFVFAGIQWVVISLKSKEVRKAEDALSHHKKLIDKYAQLLQLIAQTEFSNSYLMSIKNEARHASDRILKFSRLVNAFESRQNAIANLFGNSLYLYDLQCLYRLEKWRYKNKDEVTAWLGKIAEADSLISLATFHFNHQENSFPIITEELTIQSVEMGHPLIHAKDRVSNTFTIGDPGNIMLITGANMAGKSTFLRTVGVNMILSFCGGSVCAKQFMCPLVILKTSMRATDSLVDHQSYFYAELSRLKMIMEEVRSMRPTLILLDEILRGTNSNDKHDGSVGLIKQFVTSHSLVMLASHDVELGVLVNQFPDAIRNYCFESEIENDALVFDYTLHEGVAQKANATFLMQKMGILPSAE
jgi:DNA mismatch repair ATPase MutS